MNFEQIIATLHDCTVAEFKMNLSQITFNINTRYRKRENIDLQSGRIFKTGTKEWYTSLIHHVIDTGDMHKLSILLHQPSLNLNLNHYAFIQKIQHSHINLSSNEASCKSENYNLNLFPADYAFHISQNKLGLLIIQHGGNTTLPIIDLLSKLDKEDLSNLEEPLKAFVTSHLRAKMLYCDEAEIESDENEGDMWQYGEASNCSALRAAL